MSETSKANRRRFAWYVHGFLGQDAGAMERSMQAALRARSVQGLTWRWPAGTVPGALRDLGSAVESSESLRDSLALLVGGAFKTWHERNKIAREAGERLALDLGRAPRPPEALIGYSLGAYVALLACQSLKDRPELLPPRIVIVAAAAPSEMLDPAPAWLFRRLYNVWAAQDSVLRLLYRVATGLGQEPIGLGRVARASNLQLACGHTGYPRHCRRITDWVFDNDAPATNDQRPSKIVESRESEVC